MAKHRTFEDILNESLEDVQAGRATVEECLARDPERAAELDTLLRLALSAGKACGVEPSAEAKTRARYRFQEAVRARNERRMPRRHIWQGAWAIGLAAVLAIAILGSGTVAASAASMPDQPLYPVKMAREQVQLTLTRSPLAKARLNAAFAETRLQEMEQMAATGKLDQVGRLTAQLDKHLAQMEDQPKLTDTQVAALRTLLEAQAEKNIGQLQKLEERLPPQARAAVNKALQLSEARYEKALSKAGVKPEQMDKIKSDWQKGPKGNNGKK